MRQRSRPRPPRWYGVAARVFLVTFVGTLLCFAVSLFLGILGTVTVAALRGTRANMTFAYRGIAMPAALVAGSVIFALTLATEIRHHRQMKSLSAIERMS